MGAPRQARIILDNPTLDSIEAVVMDGPRVLMRTPSGAAFGRSEDLIPTFSLPLNEAHDLWFRIRSTKPLVLPFTLTHEERVESLRDNRDLAVALYTGIVLAILIYNCFLSFSTGQQAYFSYVLVVLTACCCSLCFATACHWTCSRPSLSCTLYPSRGSVMRSMSGGGVAGMPGGI